MLRDYRWLPQGERWLRLVSYPTGSVLSDTKFFVKCCFCTLGLLCLTNGSQQNNRYWFGFSNNKFYMILHSCSPFDVSQRAPISLEWKSRKNNFHKPIFHIDTIRLSDRIIPRDHEGGCYEENNLFIFVYRLVVSDGKH